MEEHYPSKLGVAGSNPAERRRNNSARIRVLACHAKSRGFKSHFLRNTTWWNGRHGRLKICSSLEDMGSSPVVGILHKTIFYNKMRILKNNLYIQQKNTKKFAKTPLINLFEHYKNTITDQINLENNNKLLPHLIYNQNTTKKTRKLKKITYISLLNVILKKLIFYTISYKKLTTLLEIWMLNNYTKYIAYLSKIKISNNKLIFFYIKKKCNLLFDIIEKLKFTQLNQFLVIFFKTNKKLKYALDTQINLTILKNKNISNLIQKIKTILYSNITTQLQNKHFFNEFLMLLKALKKELIYNFFSTNKKNIHEQKNIKFINKNFFNLFIKKNYNTPLLEFKQVIKKHTFNNIDQIDTFYKHTQNSLFEIKLKKKENTENILKWIFLNMVLSQTNNLIFKFIYKLTIQQQIKTQVINIEKKNIINLEKEKVSTFILQNNILSHLLNSKNTKNVFYNYKTNLHFILVTLENKNKWYKEIINQYKKYFTTTKETIKKKKQKKSANTLYNTLVNTLNKKYGITYNCLLLNDTLGYWTKDYNAREEKKKNHLQNITDIQKNTYKILTIKYLTNTTNIPSANNTKINNAINYLKNNITNNTQNTMVTKKLIAQFNI